jgi:hypothetical protein
MCTFAVIAHRHSTTNTRLGSVLSPAQALKRLGPGDIALGRLDILPSLDGVEPGLWALDRLSAIGVTVLNGRRTLVAIEPQPTRRRSIPGDDIDLGMGEQFGGVVGLHAAAVEDAEELVAPELTVGAEQEERLAGSLRRRRVVERKRLIVRDARRRPRDGERARRA